MNSATDDAEVTASAQREMIFPGLLAVLAPLVNGYVWRLAGGEDRLLGAKYAERTNRTLASKDTNE